LGSIRQLQLELRLEVDLKLVDHQKYLCPYRYHFEQLGNRSHNNVLLFLQLIRSFRYRNLDNVMRLLML
jgi:hypothetical protein